jgi:cell wall-associated NlpC family hydrolase
MLRALGTAGLLLVALSGCASSAPPPVWTPRAYESADTRSATAIGFAEAQVGKRYCWGGNGPACFDCSGLVAAAWRWAGIALPRTAAGQGRALVEVPRETARPGDILWWPHHVGLYVGAGTMIDAYNSRSGVVRRRAVIPVRVLRVPAP